MPCKHVLGLRGLKNKAGIRIEVYGTENLGCHFGDTDKILSSLWGFGLLEGFNNNKNIGYHQTYPQCTLNALHPITPVM